MLAPVTHILPLMSYRRARILPVKGRVYARIGQTVDTDEVIAKAQLREKHILINVYEVLGSTEKKLINRKVGDKVQQGDVIAATDGLFKKVVRAPADGVIMTISGGQVLLGVRSKIVELKAGYPGQVSEIIPDRGVIIDGSGVMVQGSWGNEEIGLGPLHMLSDSPMNELQRDQLTTEMQGTIGIGGYCGQSNTLKAAGDILKGLILSSMSSKLIETAKKMPIPVILLEGFGRIPMNKIAFDLLNTNAGRVASLIAVPWEPVIGDRPEIIVQLPASGESVPETDMFQSGQNVRIFTPPYAGRIGKLEKVLSTSTLLPNGLRVPAANVRLEENNEIVVVPLANMDVIE